MTESRPLGRFVGIGVGPGPARLLSVAAWEELQRCDLICYPRATSHESSAALHALDGLELPQAEWREISFEMSSDRDRLRKYYMELALSLRGELELGRRVGYLTLGDLMTYSTYGYLITALREIYPQLQHRTYAVSPASLRLLHTLIGPSGKARNGCYYFLVQRKCQPCERIF